MFAFLVFHQHSK